MTSPYTLICNDNSIEIPLLQPRICPDQSSLTQSPARTWFTQETHDQPTYCARRHINISLTFTIKTSRLAPSTQQNFLAYQLCPPPPQKKRRRHHHRRRGHLRPQHRRPRLPERLHQRHRVRQATISQVPLLLLQRLQCRFSRFSSRPPSSLRCERHTNVTPGMKKSLARPTAHKRNIST